jgi:hypothetical protein
MLVSANVCPILALADRGTQGDFGLQWWYTINPVQTQVCEKRQAELRLNVSVKERQAYTKTAAVDTLLVSMPKARLS